MSDVEMMKDLKGSSSKWINDGGMCSGRFAWQAGYGWFSVSPADVDVAQAYVENQKTHHRGESFQNEFRKFLTQYKVEYDERYVWD